MYGDAHVHVCVCGSRTSSVAVDEFFDIRAGLCREVQLPTNKTIQWRTRHGTPQNTNVQIPYGCFLYGSDLKLYKSDRRVATHK